MALNLLDITSNNNDLTNGGNVAEITTNLPFTQSTSAADFEAGTSDYLYINDASQTGLDLSSSGTIEFWVNFESLPTTVYEFISKSDNAATRSYQFYIYKDGATYKVEAEINQDGSTRDVYDWIVTPSTGVWYHYAVTIDAANASATTFEFFVDGSSQGNGTAVVSGNAGNIANSSNPFQIGASNSSGTPSQFLDGKMDDIRIWNDVRTGTEISNNKSIELVGNEANLVAYWPFETTLGSTGESFFLLL